MAVARWDVLRTGRSLAQRRAVLRRLVQPLLLHSLATVSATMSAGDGAEAQAAYELQKWAAASSAVLLYPDHSAGASHFDVHCQDATPTAGFSCLPAHTTPRGSLSNRFAANRLWTLPAVLQRQSIFAASACAGAGCGRRWARQSIITCAAAVLSILRTIIPEPQAESSGPLQQGPSK